MSLTLLVDLDDTLLGNDIDQFLPPYLKALSAGLVDYAPPAELIAQLMAATQRMVENRRPDCTLQQVFEQAFYPALGLDLSVVQKPIEEFYAQTFPALQRYTQPRPEAVALVQAAMERSYRVVIATNPLFPRAAIEHRLRWAGLPPEEYDFAAITTYENFHFAKPSPAYYAEILAHLGWPEGPVVMVGDDLENDIVPARQMGLPAFWLVANGPSPEGPEGPSAAGGLGDVLPWLEQQAAEEAQPDYNRTSAMLAILRSTPAGLDSLCENLSLEAWTRRTQPEEWSLVEVLCHLRDVDTEVNLPRLKTVLQEDNPFLPGMDTDPWAQERQYICQNGPRALAAFTAARLRLLKLLEKLQPEDWHRPARHAIFSRTTLAELVSIIGGHDRLHIRQVHQQVKG